MRIIFLNRYFHPDHSATSQMLSDLAFALAQSGAQSGGRSGGAVTVIASRQLYDDPARRLPARQRVNGVDVIRVATSRFGRRTLPGRALDYASFYASAARALWRLAGPGDIVIAKTDPPMLSALIHPLARARGARTVTWLQDIFPEVAARLRVGGAPARLAFAVLGRARNRSLGRADANVVLGERMAAHLAGLGVARGRIVTIPNWADGRAIAPVPPAANRWRAGQGLAPDPAAEFVVMYSGNLGRAHDIDTMLAAIALLGATPQPGRSGPRITWLFVGAGTGLATLRRRLRPEHAAHVRFAPYQPRERLAETLSAADLHLVSLRPELEGLIVPSKLYGIAAAGRPTLFIGDPDGEIPRILARHHCGVSVRQGDAPGLAKAILELAANPALCTGMGEAARRLFDSEYDQPIAVARWQSLLARLAAPAQPDPCPSRNAR
jgi:glycosyltransferase involved in cell wall biosynthesis